jgi:hypothetical protein
MLKMLPFPYPPLVVFETNEKSVDLKSMWDGSSHRAVQLSRDPLTAKGLEMAMCSFTDMVKNNIRRGSGVTIPGMSPVADINTPISQVIGLSWARNQAG